MNEAREIVGRFLSAPFGMNPAQAKYFAGILIDSHIHETNDGTFSNPDDLRRNNEKWKALKKTLEKI